MQKSLVFALTILLVVASALAAQEVASTSQNVTQVSSTSGLEIYPPELLRVQDNPYQVVCVYFVPKDREPQEGYRERMATLLTFVKALFDDAMKDFYPSDAAQRGLTFRMWTDEKPLVLEIRGRRPCAYYTAHSERTPYVKRMQLQFKKIEAEVTAFYKREQQHLPPLKQVALLVFAETYDEGGSLRDDNFVSAGGGGWRTAVVTAKVLTPEYSAATIGEQIGRLIERDPNDLRGVRLVAHELGHICGADHDPDEAGAPRYIMQKEGYVRKIGLNFVREPGVESQALVFSQASIEAMSTCPLLRWYEE